MAEGSSTDGTITVDKLPSIMKVGDVLTRVDEKQVIIRGDDYLWIAERLLPTDILDVDVVE